MPQITSKVLSFTPLLGLMLILPWHHAGLDPAEMISQLRAAHAEDETKMGVDVVSGHAGDMEKLGIFESFKVRSSLHNVVHCLPSEAPVCQQNV